MKSYSLASKALVITGTVAVVLFLILLSSDLADSTWIPQTVVTLVALVGASWFAGNRLDLFDRDIRQRQIFADNQLSASERTNFNTSVKEAVEMMSKKSPSTVLAGQRWLHTIAEVGSTESKLVQSLLCNYVVNAVPQQTPATANDPVIKGRQFALALLFQSPGNKRFTDCDSVPDMTGGQWRALDFSDLDLRGVNLARSDFTDTIIIGASFDDCDLRDTLWSNVGGNTQTLMRNTKLCGAKASSATFTNIDFSGANLSNNGRQTKFQACTFIECNFEGSVWTRAHFKDCKFNNCNFKDARWDGVILETPQFEQCPTVTFDLCSKAHLSDPAGLHSEVVEQLRRMGFSDSSDD